MEKIVQTAGKDQLGNFAKDFTHFNDDVLFGENWNNKDIDLKIRCIITVVSLVSQGIVDSSLKYHLQNAKNNGVTKSEIAAILTHNAFYAGWPKAWAAFNLAKDVWSEDINDKDTARAKHEASMIYPIGEENPYGKYFVGKSYLHLICKDQVSMYNVTFEPGCRNNWHRHLAKFGGGQILMCIAGYGYYQEEGKERRELKPGDIVNIPVNVKHWHGARPDSWFSHISIEVPGVEGSTEWLEPVDY